MLQLRCQGWPRPASPDSAVAYFVAVPRPSTIQELEYAVGGHAHCAFPHPTACAPPDPRAVSLPARAAHCGGPAPPTLAQLSLIHDPSPPGAGAGLHVSRHAHGPLPLRREPIPEIPPTPGRSFSSTLASPPWPPIPIVPAPIPIVPIVPPIPIVPPPPRAAALSLIPYLGGQSSGARRVPEHVSS